MKSKWLVIISAIVLCCSLGAFLYMNYLSDTRVYISNISAFMKHKKLRILVTSEPNLFGELYAAHRISDTLAGMGYGNAVVIGHFGPFYTRFADFDFALHLRPETEVDPKIFNFLAYNTAIFPITQKYDALISVVPKDVLLQKVGKGDIPVLQFYASCRATDFCDAPKRKLFYGGWLWDKYRGVHCAKIYKMLDKAGYLEVYGPEEVWSKFHLKSYKGLISEKMKDGTVETMKRTGVSLVLLSDEHFDNNTTTSRFFEPLAASNVIICDRLPFIVENFGDSVLYVDRHVSPEELFKQIDNHMQWILSHPKEAIELARKSHKIFLEKFTLEKQLQNVIDFYEQHKHEKNQ